MTEPTEPLAPTRPRRRPWQIGLRTLALLTAAIAVWLTDGLNRRHNDEMRRRIESIRPLARELVVDDPARPAAVKLEELWYDENRWDVHLPPGRYRLCLATRQVGPSELAPVAAEAPIDAGRHRIRLELEARGEPPVIAAAWEGGGVEAKESAAWGPNVGSGWSTNGVLGASETFGPDGPIVLMRRTYERPGKKFVPGDGILLWIEREGP